MIYGWGGVVLKGLMWTGSERSVEVYGQKLAGSYCLPHQLRNMEMMWTGGAGTDSEARATAFLFMIR